MSILITILYNSLSKRLKISYKHVKNGRTVFLVTVIELQCFLNIMFEIDWTILNV